jgi:acetyl-CoA synthetase
MEDAIRDRVQDSEAVAILTVPQMKDRIPKKDLPSLKHTFVVDSERGDGCSIPKTG